MTHPKGNTNVCPICNGAKARDAACCRSCRNRLRKEENAARRAKLVGPNPSGLCQCGCGARAPIARYTNVAWGMVQGQPVRFVRGHQSRKPEPELSPDDYVVEDRGYRTPCWIWQRTIDPYGYGVLSRNRGGTKKAHIAHYEAVHGPVPTGSELDHLCRVKACCRPSHLEPVKHAENVRRGAVAKLTWANVDEIRAAAANTSKRELAERYGVAVSTIGNIINGHRWVKDRP